ncbi:uncharacterized protein PITG_05720 [Phytophthora infestans T30-4]|uniref:Transmembrane protein n=1 Tax=Phytophthora infestans (strain T30-4) TaxID=403677 RepID=D0N5I7_PHYIT|nr:uncharacterized protein PITG_05720 [Phytophthora infestans T30-4]EEY70328.1 conserved hypothetical protein [Phytophthora infestans T30-4]|eukprot:XP_002997982.1 conserved hypothetical protein [Phytophthora infestans T30-4]
MFGLIMTCAQLRTEYIKIILRTFDFWFLQTANTIWAVVLSAVMSDLRVVLIVFCWLDFTAWLLQETYLRNSNAVVAVALFEWVFYVLLMVEIVLDLVDQVHHYAITTACGCTLSTKDILVNVIGTMTMLSLRNLWRRYQLVKCRKPGYSYESSRISDRPPLQMRLSAPADRFETKDTVWPRIGALGPLKTWKTAALYTCGTTGGAFATLSLFLTGSELGAVIGLVASAVFSGVYACCCQRQLLVRLVTSFHFIFLYSQIFAIGLCVVDLLDWNWAYVCGVGSSLLLTFTFLTMDALTPIMKRRLCFAYWMAIAAVVLFLTVHLVLVLDVLVFGHWDLQDRVFLKFYLLEQRATVYVIPTLLSRVATVIVWAGRFVYVAMTRQDDNALVLLRGDVEFDFEG